MSRKIDWISIVQGAAIFMVVVGHCWFLFECRLWYFCYGVHMPLFMFVSGGLFFMTRINRDWKWKDVVVDKLKRLGIPYISFIIFSYVIKILLSTKVKHPVGISLEDFLIGFVYPFKSAMKEMWFVAALFLLMLLYPVYRQVLKNKWLMLALLALAVWLSIVNKSYIGGGIFNIYGALRYGIYFYLGMLTFMYMDKWEKVGIAWGIGLLVIYAFVCVWFRQAHLPVALTGIAGFMILIRNLASKYPKLLSSFRDYSFQIFLLGLYPQMFVEIIFRNMAETWWQKGGILVLSVALGIVFPVVVSKLAARLGNKQLNMVLGLR